MRKLLSIALGAGIILGMFAGAAQASEDQGTVLVCKYVGQPGVNERLKDGKNPIETSVNSIGEYQDNDHSGTVSPGDTFSDAQDHSLVIGPEDTCPAGDSGGNVRYRIVIRMTGEGKVRDHIMAPPASDASIDPFGVVCGGRRTTAGFNVTVDTTFREYGPFTSKKGPSIRLSQAGVALIKLKSAQYC
jgi:hypothetical protein